MTHTRSAKPTPPGGDGLRAVIEDHALKPVPDDQRVGGWSLVFNTAGVGTTLVILAIGGGVTYVAGTRWGLAMGLVAAVFGSLLGWAIGRVCQVAGTSSTVTSRFYGLGARGSFLASLIFAFMVLGFLALENALLYYGTLFMFGWAPTTLNAIVIYGLLTIAWILLTTFGMKLVQRTSAILTVVSVVLVVVVTGMALAKSDLSLSDIWLYTPENLGTGDVLSGLAAIAGIAGALALTGADFGRFARSSRDVGIMAIGGSIVVNFFIVAVGTIIFQAGNSVVATFLEDPENAGTAATIAGATTAEKIAFMTQTDAGAYFIVIAGAIGFVVMYAAQAKAQVINTYSGSLALSNFFDAATGRAIGRFWWVVVGNVIGLLAVWGDILGFINGWLGALGILTTSLCTLVITDFFVVRKQVAAHPAQVENFNWAGIIALLASSGIAYGLVEAGVTGLGFAVALVLTALGYPLLRRVLPEGSFGGFSSTAAALHEDE
ncbi:cytosine permease [Actinocorallia aurea]